MRDLQHRVSLASSIAPATMTATTNGVSVDTLGYESVTMIIHAGTMTGTNPSYIPSLQTSADGATNWLSVDPSCYIGGAAPAAMTAAGVLVQGMQSAVGTGQGLLRFVRVVETVSGTTPSAPVVGDILLAYPRHSGNAV